MAGRPSFAPTREQRVLVEGLASFGTPQEDIRLLILTPKGKPISVETLVKHFGSELGTGAVKANAQIAGALFKKAKGGDVASMIFWLKTRARWREVNRTEITGADGGPVQAQSVPYDLSGLSAGELDNLEEILTKAQAAALPAPAA